MKTCNWCGRDAADEACECDHCGQRYTYYSDETAMARDDRSPYFGGFSLAATIIGGLLLYLFVSIGHFPGHPGEAHVVPGTLKSPAPLLVCGFLFSAIACVRRERHPWLRWAGLLLSFTLLYTSMALQR